MPLKNLIPIALAAFLAAPLAAAEGEGKKKEPPKKGEAASAAAESPLARAAREAREARGETKSKISIRDEDLKKEGGRITVSTGNASTAVPERSDAEELRLSVERRERQRAEAEASAKKRIEAIRGEITRLEKELGSLENVAYDEDEIELSPDQADVASRYQEKLDRLLALRKELGSLSSAAPKP